MQSLTSSCILLVRWLSFFLFTSVNLQEEEIRNLFGWVDNPSQLNLWLDFVGSLQGGPKGGHHHHHHLSFQLRSHVKMVRLSFFLPLSAGSSGSLWSPCTVKVPALCFSVPLELTRQTCPNVNLLGVFLVFLRDAFPVCIRYDLKISVTNPGGKICHIPKQRILIGFFFTLWKITSFSIRKVHLLSQCVLNTSYGNRPNGKKLPNFLTEKGRLLDICPSETEQLK